MRIGYARVSTEDQTLALQHDALCAAGCEVIHDDKLSGANANRPGLAAALGQCQAGDVLHVWKLDRLGRSMVDLVNTMEGLRTRGVGLTVLTGVGASIDSTSPEGEAFLGMAAVFAQFERSLNRERTKAGLQAARRRGKRLGRRPSLDHEKVLLARRMIADGENRATVARVLGCGLSTLRRALNG